MVYYKDTAATEPGNYALIQLILYCGFVTDITAGDQSSTYHGTQGPEGDLDTLDGGIFPVSAPVSIQSNFSYGLPDSPGFPLPNLTNPTDQASAYASYMFRTIAMYQFGVDSDPAHPNIWVPLNAEETWSYEGIANYNIQDASQVWEASGSPTSASFNSILALTEPSWAYVVKVHPGNLKEQEVTSCQN